ncbi:uncharacterized protein PFL1_00931 [Pseudozyma flocculosa PF-1]|nr:uncharacterized protein PFL1_00931 [Pseudozyma flocculosa PF-1]EPQ31598.1 hypothetical protein PFL1_00931 [Pseudozyma flocculosa PF-1]
MQGCCSGSNIKEKVLLKMIESRWAGDFKIIDCCGVRVPLKCASIDRIDSTKGYTASNIRLMALGLNMLKKSSDDLEVYEYLSYLRNREGIIRPV